MTEGWAHAQPPPPRAPDQARMSRDRL